MTNPDGTILRRRLGMLTRPRTRVVVQGVLLVLALLAGYLLANWWASSRETTALAQICARVDYISGLQQDGDAQDTTQQDFAMRS